MSSSDYTDGLERQQRIREYEAYDSDCTPAVKVVISENEIPVINSGVETTVRRDGPMDINMATDLYFPVEWKGTDITQFVRPFHENSNVMDPVDIRFLDLSTKDDDDPEYITYHRGFPHRYGGGSEGNLERRLRVADISILLKSIPYTESYRSDAQLGTILKDAVTKLEKKQSVFNSINISSIDTDRELPEQYMENLGDNPQEANTEDFTDLAGSAVSFQRNENTLLDVFEFINSKVEGELYFYPTSDDQSEISLVFEKNRHREFSGGDFDSDGPTVMKNNGLYEIQPINSVQVNGSPRNRIRDIPVNFLDGEVGRTQEYIAATAQHTDLYNQANMELKPPIFNSDSRNEEALRKEAQEQLIDRIEGGGMGEIVLDLFPYIRPHDVITAPPGCGQNIDADVEPISYSVESVTHSVGWEGDNFFERTILRANTHVTEDDIEVEITEKSLENNE